MRALVLAWSLLGALATASALGQSEDPDERLTRTWNLEAVRTLEIRGQVSFELAKGPTPRVTVEASRALFDQLTVSNWWGAATVAIESGLRGPREQGTVNVKVVLPSLAELKVSDRSFGQGRWPGASGRLSVSDHSSVDLELEATDFAVETSWLTSVVLRGQVGRLVTDQRHQSRVDARSLRVDEATLALDEGSEYVAGSTGRGRGLARHASRVSVPDPAPWSDLRLLEDSRRVGTSP